MAGEIRNWNYPTTVVDLLLPPSGANPRGGESDEGFDSMLRALAPIEQRESRQSFSDAPPPSSAENEGRVDSRGYSDTRSSDQRRQVAERNRELDEAQRAREDAATQADEQAVSDSPPAQQNADGGTVDHVSSEPSEDKEATAPVDAVPPEQAKPDGEEAAEVLDPAAMELAALAAQAAAAAEQPKPKTESASAEGTAELPLEGAAAESQAAGLSPSEAVVKLPEVPGVNATVPPTQPTGGEAEPASAGTAEIAADATEIVVEASGNGSALATEEVVAAAEEVPEISNLKSTHTRKGDEIFHEVDPKQAKGSGNDAAVDPAAELTADQPGENQVETDPASRMPAVEAASDSKSKNDKERDEPEARPLEQLEPATEPTVEVAAVEPAPAELPPVENSPKSAAEQARTDDRAQGQSTQPIVDGNARPGGAPRLAAEVLAGGTREASHARPVEIDSARFLTRVARAFTAAQERGGEVQLRLSPPELGSLRVEVKVLDGVMTARVETENAAAKTAVLEHLPQLRERLAEQGVRIERFDVDLMQNGSSGSPDHPTDRQPEEAIPRRQHVGRGAMAGRTNQETPAAAAGMSASSGLNVIV